MSPVCLLGASGFTGLLVGHELAERGRRIVACGRDVDRVRAAVAPFGDAVDDVRHVDLDAPGSLDRALSGTRRAITTIGPYHRLGRVVVDAAIANGVDLVDVSGEQAYVRWANEARHASARAAGVTLVPGAGFTGAIGDLLAAIAADAAGARPQVHISYMTGGGGRRSWSNGTRRSVAEMLGHHGHAYVDGGLVPEPVGEGRRLAWFPRPVGPMHAAAVPGTEAITVPRHLKDVGTVRTYLAMSAWKAEAFQALGTVSRYPAVRRRLARWISHQSSDPSPARRADTRWACVAEAQGEAGVARAWAYGRDPYGIAAKAAVSTMLSLGGPRTRPGVWSPAAAMDPVDALDGLSVLGPLRWSVVRPDG